MGKVAILDAGSQFGKLIDKKVRICEVESEIFPINTSISNLGDDIEAIIVSGGPQSVNEQGSPRIDESILESGLPILWICYGFQLINHIKGGEVQTGTLREDGIELINITNNKEGLFKGLDLDEQVLMSHGDSIKKVGKGFKVTAKSANGVIAAMESVDEKYYAVQFHPETDASVNGTKMISNFLDITGIERDFTMQDREEKAIEEIREHVGDNKVLCLVSGGVDSTVLARLLLAALEKEQVMLVHVDNGFMRLDESRGVVDAFRKIDMEIDIINGEETFLDGKTIVNGKEVGPLREMTNPEYKRKIIGDTFMRISDQKIRELCEQKGWDFDSVIIAQGTLRPDLIESASILASSNADAIKTHHNDTELVREKRERNMILEPLKDYHKDEVRELGESLGLSHSLVWRQPFPGPGLSIRTLCVEEAFKDDTFYATNVVLKTLTNFADLDNTKINELEKLFHDNSVPDEVEKRLISLSGKISATLLPVKTVGVQGDGRTYSYVVGLTGDENWEDLFYLSKLIPKLCHNVNRVVYISGERIDEEVMDITVTHLGRTVLDKLRKADKIVNDILLEYDLIKTLSQVPVILVPLPFGQDGNHSIAIRTFITNDFMTGVPAVPGDTIPQVALDKMRDGILKIDHISKVMYDLTSKPPGTTEWE